MTHPDLPSAEAQYETRVSANNRRYGDHPGVRDELNSWLQRGATVPEAVNLVYLTVLKGFMTTHPN